MKESSYREMGIPSVLLKGGAAGATASQVWRASLSQAEEDSLSRKLCMLVNEQKEKLKRIFFLKQNHILMGHLQPSNKVFS